MVLLFFWIFIKKEKEKEKDHEAAAVEPPAKKQKVKHPRWDKPGRPWTVAVAIPANTLLSQIGKGDGIEKAQANLAWRISRALALFSVDEIILLHEETGFTSNNLKFHKKM